MKRILYVSDALSVHTRRWAEHYRDRGVEVHVASFRPADIDGVQVHLLPTGGLGRLGYFLAIPVLRRLWRDLRPDVVHAQYVTSYGFLAALARLRPLIVTAWGTDVLISPRESRLLRWFATYALKRADAITTVALHMNAAVHSLIGPQANVVAVPFGVDTQRFRLPATPRPPRDVLRLVCTRNFGPIYSVHTLIEALAEVAARGLVLDVDLGGQGALREELEKLVVDRGLAARVTFHGHVTHERLAQMLAMSDIFVTPALSDGNNVSLNEAMACGTFPIATDIPANAQWIEDGGNGLLYPGGDVHALATAITRAAGDAELRERSAAVNRQIVETRADWHKGVARMDDVYARAMRELP